MNLKPIIITTIVVLLMCGTASAWLTGYDHRMAITVNNGGASSLSYYQFSFTNDTNVLVAAGNMQASGADCRITDASDNLLPFWNETPFNAAGTKIWVNATTLAVGDNTFYMYYGNAGASSVANGTNAFEIFDDFDTLDTGGNPTLSPAAWGDSVLVDSIYYMFCYSSGDVTRCTTTDFTSYNNITSLFAGKGAAILKDPDGITPIQYDGKYWMAFQPSDTEFKIAWASSITGAWTDIGVKIAIGAGGQWDDTIIYDPSFVKDGDTYYIFYRGKGSVYKIGYASASTPDGTWTKSGDNPVLEPTAATWDSDVTKDPVIRKFDSTYYLFYTGSTADNSLDKNGYATSDTITGTWTKYGSNPILIGESTKWDVWVSYPNVFKIGSSFYMDYDGHKSGEPTKKGLATTSSLTGTWTKYTGKWEVGGSPSVSSGELLINAADEYIRSSDTFQYKALKARVKLPSTPNSYHFFGFHSDTGASTTDSEMLVTYDTPDLKTWSGNADAKENTSIYNAAYFGSYHDYEILWKNGEAKFYIDDGLKDTDTTEVCNSAQPVGFYDSVDLGDLYVDWAFVRNYASPEPTATLGAEETGGGGGNTIVLGANKYGMLRKSVTSAQTFSTIAGEFSHDICFTWWDSTNDRWESYYSGDSYNSAKSVPEHDSYFVLMDGTGETVSCSVAAAENVDIPIGWSSTYLRESTSKTLSEIKTDMGSNCADIYAWDHTASGTGAWTNTGTFSVLPNQGILVDASNGFTWDGSVS